MTHADNTETSTVITPTYVKTNSMVSIYYHSEFMTVARDQFYEEKMTECILLIHDLSRARIAVKTTNEEGDQDVTIFRDDKVLTFFTNFDSKNRQEIIAQLDKTEIANKLNDMGLGAYSQSILKAQ